MDNKRYLSFNLMQTKIIYNFFLNGTEIEKILYKTFIKKLCLKQEIINSSHDMCKFGVL